MIIHNYDYELSTHIQLFMNKNDQIIPNLHLKDQRGEDAQHAT